MNFEMIGAYQMTKIAAKMRANLKGSGYEF